MFRVCRFPCAIRLARSKITERCPANSMTWQMLTRRHGKWPISRHDVNSNHVCVEMPRTRGWWPSKGTSVPAFGQLLLSCIPNSMQRSPSVFTSSPAGQETPRSFGIRRYNAAFQQTATYLHPETDQSSPHWHLPGLYLLT